MQEIVQYVSVPDYSITLISIFPKRRKVMNDIKKQCKYHDNIQLCSSNNPFMHTYHENRTHNEQPNRHN